MDGYIFCADCICDLVRGLPVKNTRKMKNQERPYAWPVIIGGNVFIILINLYFYI